MFPVPIYANIETDLDSQATSLDHYVPPFRLTDSGNGTNGFMLVSDGLDTQTLNTTLKARADLFDNLRYTFLEKLEYFINKMWLY